VLILMGTVPTAYALNQRYHHLADCGLRRQSRQSSDVIQKYISTPAVSGDARAAIADYIRTREFAPATVVGIQRIVNDLANEAET